MPYEIGGFDDEVRLELDGQAIHIAESWDMVESILAQPATWSMQLGNSAVAAEIIERYPKRTPFRAFIGDTLQLSGHIDGIGARGQATQVLIKGRDGLADLHDSGIEQIRSFRDGTYTDIVKYALEAVGLDPTKLISSNAANRKIKTGIPIAELESPAVSDLVLSEEVSKPGEGLSVGAVTKQEHQNQINESALAFVRRHIDRAGLFLWATADGHFVLSLPNGKQKAAYRLIRRKDGRDEGANIVDFDFMDDATHRHGIAAVYARSGGRKHGRVKISTGVTDQEMVNTPDFARGYRTVVVYRDANVQNKDQCEFFCRRKLAEERRNGYQLSYTVAGHTLPAIGGGRRAVVTPDTTIEVIDEVLGIEETMYIETVRRQRHDRTTTSLRLMRLGDLLFGGDP